MKNQFYILFILPHFVSILLLAQGTYETEVGHDAGKNSKGISGVFVGRNAGENTNYDESALSLPPDDDGGYIGGAAVFIGSSSGLGSVGGFNSFFGTSSGLSNLGNFNTFQGVRAGFRNKGDKNTFIGVHAGNENIGNQNTFSGMRAGRYNQGNQNVAYGYESGFDNKGYYNNFFGPFSGYKNTGASNVFAGNNAGKDNTGSLNVFIGNLVGSVKNSGSNNTFVGYESGVFNKSGYDNLFMGMRSGNKNLFGRQNSFAGAQSGRNNTSGNLNAFFGFQSGFESTFGHYNAYLGAYSGHENISGAYNTFIGYESGRRNTGSNNTYLGSGAGRYSGAGSGNVFVGYRAGWYENASEKLVIANGPNTGDMILYGDFQQRNLVVGGKTNTDFTLHVLGEAYTTGTWKSSDERFKKDIEPIEGALDILLAMEGKRYKFKEDSVRKFHEGWTYGFIAQDVQKVLPSVVQEDPDGYLALNYECYIPLLVEAVKEMKTENNDLTAVLQTLMTENESLQEKVKALEEKVGIITPIEDELEAQSVVLHQNVPNPFDQSTRIAYEVTQNAQQVSLHVYDLNGTELLQFTGLPAGEGAVNVQAGQLKAGMYLYSLVADGKVIATKRMILTR